MTYEEWAAEAVKKYGFCNWQTKDAWEAAQQAAPAGAPEQITIPAGVWQSWQTWGNAWFSICAALSEAWPSWNQNGDNAIDAACKMIKQLAAWENERRALSIQAQPVQPPGEKKP